MRKVCIILILLTLSRTLLSCCKDKGYNFRWSSAKVTNINASGDRPTALTTDSVDVGYYGFQLNFQDERVAF
jgi:hypothetical protein